MLTDKCVERPSDYYIIKLLRRLLENEEVTRFTIREYFDREVDLGCPQYLWTGACTFDYTR